MSNINRQLASLAQQIHGNDEHQAVLHVVRRPFEGHAPRLDLGEQIGEQRAVEEVELQPEQGGCELAGLRNQQIDLWN